MVIVIHMKLLEILLLVVLLAVRLVVLFGRQVEHLLAQLLIKYYHPEKEHGVTD